MELSGPVDGSQAAERTGHSPGLGLLYLLSSEVCFNLGIEGTNCTK